MTDPDILQSEEVQDIINRMPTHWSQRVVWQTESIVMG